MPPAPSLPAYRCCPVCAQRRHGRINPDCPVCQGAGTLVLGPNSRRVEPDTALESIELALEQVATAHLGANPTGQALHTGRDVLAATMQRMIDHGLVADTTAAGTAALIVIRHRTGTLTAQDLTTIANAAAHEARNPQTAPDGRAKTGRSHAASRKPSPRPAPRIA